MKTIKGKYVDIFDSELSVVDSVRLTPGKRVLLKDLSAYPRTACAVVASSSKILNETNARKSFSFTSEGPDKTNCRTRIYLTSAPASVNCSESSVEIKQEWDAKSSTLLLTYPNRPEPYSFTIRLR